MKARSIEQVEADLKRLNHEWLHAAGFLHLCPEGPSCAFAKKGGERQ